MNAAIIGASGYIGETLVGLLARHPHATLKAVTSRSKAGQRVSAVIPEMRGVLDDLLFETSNPADLAQRSDIDCFFLAVPHGTAVEYARALVDAGKKVIDLSADFRLNSAAIYEEYYGDAHPDPDLLANSHYVLPEITADGWQDGLLLASPGCYPTSILTPLFPLLKAGVIGKEHIVVSSFSGVSGAGKKAVESLIFCEVNESAKAYSIPKHRHLSEIEEQLGLADKGEVIIQFSPHLAPMQRGIATTITVPAGESSLDDLYQAWHDAYDARPFVYLLPSEERPETKYVSNTNRIDMSAVKDERTGNFVITSALDNLMKGAASQAIQTFNIWHGWPETAGLMS